MRVIQSLAAMQRQALKWRTEGRRIGFVPTMGYLHDGHLSLVRQARRAVGRGGVVVLSIYVNPTQFGPQEDLARYPRDLPRDLRLCRGEGVDVVFTPSDAQMYPGRETGDYSTYVVEEQLSRGMEGASRPSHFRGVTTVVAKLFLLVQPHVAVFGEKDFQQAAIIRRMTRDLNFPLKIIVAPTCREADGLAMSSRNKYLTPQQREQAVCLYRALCHAREIVRQAPHPVEAHQLRIKLRQEIEARPEARVDYIEFFDPETLRPQARVQPGHRMALAVWVGATRLIDNGAL
ncbi:MAG: pantoate--beta-alanine ligase [Verrucomicrobiae bacterium]|nr:pantoate--beta-alanine ligase [Verrucomicrobiae bacterium]